MNHRKHLAGVALFLAIFAGTVFIFNILTIKSPEIPVSNRVTPHPATEVELSYEVPYVSLDFINQRSYAMVRLEATTSRSVPRTLWVRTYFFAPDDNQGRVWASEVTEIHNPSAESDRIEIVTTAFCNLFTEQSAPKSGYFARVFVSTRSAADTSLADSEINRDITTATPVVVQAERKFSR